MFKTFNYSRNSRRVTYINDDCAADKSQVPLSFMEFFSIHLCFVLNSPGERLQFGVQL